MRHAATLFGGEPAEVAMRPSRRLVLVLALIAALAMSMSIFFALGHGFAYHDRDEGPNVSYAIDLYEGHLPTINTHVSATSQYPFIKVADDKYVTGLYLEDNPGVPTVSTSLAKHEYPQYQLIWTANHPPVYYLLGVPFVALANAVHVPLVALIGMRLVSALAFGVTMVLIGLIAFEVTPRRPAAAVLATAVASSCAVLAAYAGFVSNDTVAAAGSALTVLATLRILRLGVTRNRLLVLVLAGAAGAATKAPGVITVVMCAAALGVTLLLRNRTALGLRRAVGVTALAAGVPGLVIGWFYVRNMVLYGDPTASAALLQRYQRSSVGSTFDVLVSPRFWHGWFDTLWIPIPLRGGWMHWLLDGATLVAVLGLALGIIARIRDHSAETHRAELATAAISADGLARGATRRMRVRVPRSPSVATVGLLVLIAHAVVILVNLAQFRSGGGQAHERYLLTVLPLVAIVVSLGVLAIVDALPIGEVRRREEVATALLTTLVLAFSAVMFYKLIDQMTFFHALARFEPVAYAVLGLGGLAGIGAVLAILAPRRTPATDEAERAAVRIVEPRRTGETAAETDGGLVRS